MLFFFFFFHVSLFLWFIRRWSAFDWRFWWPEIKAEMWQQQQRSHHHHHHRRQMLCGIKRSSKPAKRIIKIEKKNDREEEKKWFGIMWINLFLAVSVRSPVDDKLFYENMYIECISRQWNGRRWETNEKIKKNHTQETRHEIIWKMWLNDRIHSNMIF